MTVSDGVEGAEPVVIDTMIAGALFSHKPLATKYGPHVQGRTLVISFVTVAELRYGALKANWGEARRDALEARLSSMTVVPSDSDLATVYAELRVSCERIGHGLQTKIHEADRWIAATAIRFGLPLVSHDGIFQGVPGLTLIHEPD
jgi:predicted nucleic acid-binding protein